MGVRRFYCLPLSNRRPYALSPCFAVPAAPLAKSPSAAELRAKAVSYANVAMANLKEHTASLNSAKFNKVCGLPFQPSKRASVRHSHVSQDAKFYGELVKSLADEPSVKKFGPASKALRSAAPVLGQLASALGLLAPFILAYVQLLYDLYLAALNYLPAPATPVAAGLVLCFFGGEFYCLLAAYEAFQVCGGAAATEALQVVSGEAAAVLEASASDDAKDAGAKAAPAAAVLRKKVLLFARLAHPEALTAALGKLWRVWVGVLATLRLKTARTLVLGASIADQLLPLASRHVMPLLDAAVPAELHKWNETLLSLALKLLAVLAAAMLATLLAAVHSALRGGQLAARPVLQLLQQRGALKGPVDDRLVHSVALGLAALGLLSQVTAGFAVPFPVSLVLWPVTTAEWVLRGAVGFSHL